MSDGNSTYKLNPKQRAFCAEYIKDHNATQAAIRAGYSERSARFVSAKHITKANILSFIAELEKNVIPDAVSIARDNVRFWISMRDGSMVADRDKVKASELLGKYAGMFVDRVGNPDGTALFPQKITVEVVKAQEPDNAAS